MNFKMDFYVQILKIPIGMICYDFWPVMCMFNLTELQNARTYILLYGFLYAVLIFPCEDWKCEGNDKQRFSERKKIWTFQILKTAVLDRR